MIYGNGIGVNPLIDVQALPLRISDIERLEDNERKGIGFRGGSEVVGYHGDRLVAHRIGGWSAHGDMQRKCDRLRKR
jgi:hypothetical protein